MNVGGGEAADQLVRMMLAGAEVTVRLGGSALKNLLALTVALAKNNKVLSGKVNMTKMLKETRDLRQFPMTPQQYKQFAKRAKKQKILFSVIRDRDDRGKLRNVILPVTELDRANAILEQIMYREPVHQPAREPPEPERADPVPERETQEHQRRRVRVTPVQEERQDNSDFRPHRNQREATGASRDASPPGNEAPEPEQANLTPEPEIREGSLPRVRVREMSNEERRDNPKSHRHRNQREVTGASENASPSEHGSNATRTSSAISREAGTVRMTSERPSVAQRLELYRVQLTRMPTPEKAKAHVKVRPKAR